MNNKSKKKLSCYKKNYQFIFSYSKSKNLYV